MYKNNFNTHFYVVIYDSMFSLFEVNELYCFKYVKYTLLCANVAVFVKKHSNLQ